MKGLSFPGLQGNRTPPVPSPLTLSGGFSLAFPGRPSPAKEAESSLHVGPALTPPAWSRDRLHSWGRTYSKLKGKTRVPVASWGPSQGYLELCTGGGQPFSMKKILPLPPAFCPNHGEFWIDR